MQIICPARTNPPPGPTPARTHSRQDPPPARIQPLPGLTPSQTIQNQYAARIRSPPGSTPRQAQPPARQFSGKADRSGSWNLHGTKMLHSSADLAAG